MANPLHIHVDLSLRAFSQSLKAPEEYSDEGRQLCHQVGLLLEQKLKYVATRNVGGSVGKKTDVIAPDFDIVILVNDHLPPFEQVFEDFEDLLILNERELKILPKSLKKNTAALRFEFTNRVSVDLVPATTLTRDEVLSIISKDPSKSYQYSSSLVKDVVGFMKDQTSFVHSMARLAKSWYKTLYFGESVSGGSSIIELISVGVALHEEQTMEEKSELRTLLQIIRLIQNLDSIRLVFRKKNGAVEGEPAEWEAVWRDFHPTDFGNKEISSRKCFLVEPANPFNDLLHDMKSSVVEKFKKFATVTRSRIEAMMDGKYTVLVDGKLTVMFDQLFASQPSDLIAEFPLGIPHNFLISYNSPSNSIYCDMKVRREKIMVEPATRSVVEIVQNNLFWTVNSIVREKPEGTVTLDDIRSGIARLVRANFRKELVSGTDNHENFDVTLSVPYKMNENYVCVQFSLKWR